MTESTGPLADLILARLAMPGKKPPAPGAIHKDLSPLFRGGLTKERVNDVLDELRKTGSVQPKGQGLTDEGRVRAMAYLGLQQLPPKCNWAAVKAKFLVPKALGLKPWSEAEVARVASADKLAGRLIQSKYDLPVSAETNLSGVLEALVCKLAGFPECTSFKSLAATALSRELKTDSPLPVKDASKLAPRLLLGTTKPGVDAYRMKVIGGTFEDAPPRDELKDFAERVKASAPSCPKPGWFGDNKVFISHLWRHIQHDSALQSFDLPAFKNRLLDANRKQYLTLSRADLVQAMNTDDVRESLISYGNAEYHFLLIP